jgi:hypothetical protein
LFKNILWHVDKPFEDDGKCNTLDTIAFKSPVCLIIPIDEGDEADTERTEEEIMVTGSACNVLPAIHEAYKPHKTSTSHLF